MGELALPPSTSSPITKQAAVWIVLAKFCSAVEEDMIPAVKRDPVDGMGVN